MLLRRRRVIRCVLGTIVLLSPSVAASQRATEGTPPIPAFEKTDTMIAMRDGVRLHTNYFVPKGFAGNLPIIMIRTPYGIEAASEASRAPTPSWRATATSSSIRTFADGTNPKGSS